MAITADDVKILPLGGCLLQVPLMTYNRPLFINARKLASRYLLPAPYSFAEIVQFIRLLRGEISIPGPIKTLATIHANFQPHPSIGDFRGFDVVLLEPSTPTDILLGDYALNRSAIFRDIVLPIRAANPGPDVAKMTNHWLNKGLLGGDEATQSELGRALINLMPRTLPSLDTYCDVLMAARPRQQDVAEGLRHLHAMIDRPTGVLTFTFRFMPDGRPVSWPAGFQEAVVSTAADLALPVFEPWRVIETAVAQQGVDAVLMPDLRHYADDFMPVMGRAIVDFAVSVAHGTAGPEQTPATATLLPARTVAEPIG
jgi:hypothetical protein